MPDINTRADSLRLQTVAVVADLPLMPVVGAIPGTAIVAAAYRNGPGFGALRSSGDGKDLSWRAPGATGFGPVVRCPSDGTYLLEDGDVGKWVRCKVSTAFLLPGTAEQLINLQDRFGLFAGDVFANEAATGITQTSDLGLKNVGRTPMRNLKTWIEPDTAPESNLALSINGGGSFSSPMSEAAGLLIGTLAINATFVLKVRRIIAAASAYKPSLLNHLAFSWSGR